MDFSGIAEEMSELLEAEANNRITHIKASKEIGKRIGKIEAKLDKLRQEEELDSTLASSISKADSLKSIVAKLEQSSSQA